jgi:integrase
LKAARRRTARGGSKSQRRRNATALPTPFSHAVRWEFCYHNPISSGIPVGSGGKRGPSAGVRISAKRQRSPLVLSPEQVRLGLAKLEIREQLLVFLDGALGIRQGERGALRWLDCDFENMCFSVEHSYYWRRGENLKSTKTETSAKPLPMHSSLKGALLEWRSQSLYNQAEDFVFSSERLKGRKPLDLASVLKKRIQPAFKSIGIYGVGWHTFRHTVGTILAEVGEHQLTIRDYLRHANLHVTNKYSQATSKTKRSAQEKLVEAIMPTGFLPKTTVVQ